jgi:hypothetical protein
MMARRGVGGGGGARAGEDSGCSIMVYDFDDGMAWGGLHVGNLDVKETCEG